jgi:starvation-inducible outer membrane lipoprotein
MFSRFSNLIRITGQRVETSVANQQSKLEIDSLPTDSMGPY